MANFSPFKEKIWLSTPTMHGPELEYLKFQLDMIEVVEEGKQPPAAEKEKSFEKN